MARRRRRWLAGSIAVTVVALIWGVLRSALFDVDDLTVRGAVQTSPADVRVASGIRTGDPLLDVDADAAATAVRAMPWIADATVARHWSGSVEISVTERVPVVAVDVGDGTAALVDGGGRVLAAVPAPPPELARVRGIVPEEPGAAMPASFGDVIALARALTPGLRTRVDAIEVVGDQLELALVPAGRARIGTIEDVDRKVVALTAVFGQVDLTDLCTVDVRVASAPGLTRENPCH